MAFTSQSTLCNIHIPYLSFPYYKSVLCMYLFIHSFINPFIKWKLPPTESQGTQNLSVAGRFPFTQVWILGTPDPRDCKRFPLKTIFRHAPVRFKTGFTALLVGYLYRMNLEGVVARIGEKLNAYRVLVGKPEGKRPLGRPTRRREDNT